ncbi:MAG: hypothetical protein A2Y62_14020 [Candidatus Fischerbacteria bacterium RBG_13_37_8]|uniref:DUF374 domain-containing protein n=1 Tax=Candidatus Fischerbacteria bacterium RBG_13_37_8 TaxID=1817863 RepID=A0A1F5VFX3_9BACT|nr:MAG: hypothetical protein A2Y62_14020 [Candidatus Fischerbacteria bacterium RBG_13_37_8]
MRNVKLWLIAIIGRIAVHLINRTLKFRVVGLEYYQELIKEGKSVIFAFYHNGIFMATYYWRKKDIAVLTSQNFDGEYTARIIKKFGYIPVRGSSSKDAIRGLVEMRQHAERGTSVAFTIDGPRGPRYIVQPGPIWIAMKTGHPILPFIALAKKKIELKSWDAFQIPYPFSTVWIVIGKPLFVEETKDKEKIEEARINLENTLHKLLHFAKHCCQLSINGSVKSEHTC